MDQAGIIRDLLIWLEGHLDQPLSLDNVAAKAGYSKWHLQRMFKDCLLYTSITKPFNPRELTIRARNLLSRTMNLGTVSEERRSVESYKFNGWELDINSRSLIGPDGEQYKLPRSEFRAMLHFCENPGKIQSRAELLKKMTGRELKPHDRTVDVTIRRIRKHFESTPDTPEIIATIHGEVYRFCSDLED